MAKVKEMWARFEKIFKEKGKTMADLGFKDGVSEEDISKLEMHLGKDLPEDFKEFLQIYNGQKDKTFNWLPDNLKLFGLDEISKSWDHELSIMPMIGERAFFTYHFQDKIKSLIFHHDRIPIAEFEEGSCNIFIDNIPGPKGKEGQLIFNVNECDFIVLADNFKDLISFYVKLLENGKLKFIEEPVSHESKFSIKSASGEPINGDRWLKLLSNLP